MRSLLKRKKNSGSRRTPFKASLSPIAILKRCAISIAAIVAAYVFSLWVIAPFLVFVMTVLKTNPLNFSVEVQSYIANGIFNGWPLMQALPLYETPLMVVVTLLTFIVLLLAIFVVNEQLTSSTVKNIFGPAASKGNEKGSARLYANELLLALLTETWNGDWNTPPAYAAPILGYSSTFGYYLAPRESHTMAFGLPGSGKTTTLNYESIDALVAAGASVVATDPKGELYDATGPDLRAKGIDVHIIDFRNPERSECINPLGLITQVFFEHYREYQKASCEAMDILQRSGVEVDTATDITKWKDRDNYSAYITALRIAENAHTNAWSKAEAYALDLATAIIPERPDAGGAKHWEDVARLLLKSLALFVGTYVEEDFIDFDDEAYTEPLPEQRTLEVVHYLLREYGGITNKRKELEVILEKIDHRHPAWTNFAQARNSRDEEYSTAVAETIKFLDAILNMSINGILNRSDFDLGKIGTKQTVIYIVLPDERPAVGKLFATLVSQMYQALIAEALRHGKKLPVPVHFLLEEVGNLGTPIPELPQKLAMGRGYNILFHLTLQGMNQLPNHYGKIGQDNLIELCGVRMLLQTTDAQNCGKYFSDNMGKYTYASNRLSRNRKVLGLIDDSASTSFVEAERPLMYPDEITRWNPEWGSIVLMSKPGKKPGLLAQLLFNYQTMMPCIFPRESAWYTSTSENLNIHDEEQMKEKACLAEAESRLDQRTPNAIWEPQKLTALDRISLSKNLLQGGISVRAQESFKRFSATQDARTYVLDYIKKYVTPDALFNGGEDYIDVVAAELKAAYREELQNYAEELKNSDKEYDHDAVVRNRKIKLAAADGLVFEILTDAFINGDTTLLATEEPEEIAEAQDELVLNKDSEEVIEVAQAEPEVEYAKPEASKKSKTVHDRLKNVQGHDRSWINEIRAALKSAYAEATTLDDFTARADAAGVLITEKNGGYIHKLKGNKNSISASKVGKKYTKSALEQHFGETVESNDSKETTKIPELITRPQQNSPQTALCRRVLKSKVNLSALEKQMQEASVTFDQVLTDNTSLITDDEGLLSLDWKGLIAVLKTYGITPEKKK